MTTLSFRTPSRSPLLALLALCALLALGAAGCFNPDFGDGGFLCAPAEGDEACPDGYTCQEFGEPGNFVCRLPPTSTVSVTVVTPQVKKGDKLKIRVNVTGFKVVDKLGQPPVGGEGHLHVFIDDKRDNWQTSAKLEEDIDLPLALLPGPHKVVTQLFNNNHTPVLPAVIASAPFTLTLK
jgi:hypothetical protein